MESNQAPRLTKTEHHHNALRASYPPRQKPAAWGPLPVAGCLMCRGTVLAFQVQARTILWKIMRRALRGADVHCPTRRRKARSSREGLRSQLICLGLRKLRAILSSCLGGGGWDPTAGYSGILVFGPCSGCLVLKPPMLTHECRQSTDRVSGRAAVKFDV